MDQQYDDLAHVEQLSDAQEKALALLPLPSVVLSIIGSSVIIYVAINSRSEQKWTPYTRLLIMMSATNALFSSTIGIGGFLRPRETSPRTWAFGTAATCSAVGFLNQIATSAVLYNAMLSCYFLLTARFNFRNSFIAKTVEPWMHLIAIGYPILTATVGAAAGEFGEMTLNGLVCWLVKFPTNCGYGRGESGEECLSKFIGWVFYGLPVLITFASIITNTIILAMYVQKQAGSSSNSRDDPSRQAERDQNKRLRLVRTQAILFLASFTVCIFWTGILNSVESTATTKEEELTLMSRWFPISVLQAIFMPLQGFLNMFVYIRPKYLKSRKEYPNESKVWAFKRSVFGDDVKPSMDSIPDAKVERVVKKTMSGIQKNPKVGAFHSNEVEFYEDDFTTPSDATTSSKKHSRSKKKISSKKHSEKAANAGDFDHVMEEDETDERWDKDQHEPAPLKRRFQSSLIDGFDLEVISETSESVFEPISTPPLHSVPAPPPPPPSLNLKIMEGRWSATNDSNSQPMPPMSPPAVAPDMPSRWRMTDKSQSEQDSNDTHMRPPSRQLSDESITGSDPDSEAIEPLDNPLQSLASPLQSLLANDTPIRAPSRHLSDDSLPSVQSSASNEAESRPVAETPAANSSVASAPTAERQAVETAQAILNSQRSRPRLRGSAFFPTTRH